MCFRRRIYRLYRFLFGKLNMLHYATISSLFWFFFLFSEILSWFFFHVLRYTKVITYITTKNYFIFLIFFPVLSMSFSIIVTKEDINKDLRLSLKKKWFCLTYILKRNYLPGNSFLIITKMKKVDGNYWIRNNSRKMKHNRVKIVTIHWSSYKATKLQRCQ